MTVRAFLSCDLVRKAMGVCVDAWERVRVAIGASMEGVIVTLSGGVIVTLGSGIYGTTVGSTLVAGWVGIGGAGVVYTLGDRYSGSGVYLVA